MTPTLQLYHHRAEHWVVVSGVARGTREDKVADLRPNQSASLPLGSLHRLENPGTEPQELIEAEPARTTLRDSDRLSAKRHANRLPSRIA
ncbi:cupin domain-containing protein [Myxococcota bacterium]|nr:cupin domain-containing protein [Myxococcota bacterium]